MAMDIGIGIGIAIAIGVGIEDRVAREGQRPRRTFCPTKEEADADSDADPDPLALRLAPGKSCEERRASQVKRSRPGTP
jgi:hypothetical protein